MDYPKDNILHYSLFVARILERLFVARILERLFVVRILERQAFLYLLWHEFLNGGRFSSQNEWTLPVSAVVQKKTQKKHYVFRYVSGTHRGERHQDGLPASTARSQRSQCGARRVPGSARKASTSSFDAFPKL